MSSGKRRTSVLATKKTMPRNMLDRPSVTMITAMIGSPIIGRNTMRSISKPSNAATISASTKATGNGSPAVLIPELGVHLHVVSNAVQRVDDVSVALEDRRAAQFARARPPLVVGTQLLVQQRKAAPRSRRRKRRVDPPNVFGNQLVDLRF